MNVLLKRAVETGELLEMIYMSNNGELSQRRIKILAISDESIRAFCYTRKQSRTFKINNILSIMPIRKHQRIGA